MMPGPQVRDRPGSARRPLIRRRGAGLLRVVPVLALLAFVPGFATPADDEFAGLRSDDYSARFDAARLLIESKQADIDARLDTALREAASSRSARASAAVQFVQWKRSGRAIAPLPRGSLGGINVLLISIDTLRADHLGCYGYRRPTTPTIDALADRGVLFENAISTSSWTLPAHMSVFTSLYASFHKLEMRGQKGNRRLDESEMTVGESLRDAGHRTAAFVAHPFLGAKWGFDRGFDLYHQQLKSAELQTDRTTLWLEWHQFNVRHGTSPPNFFLFLHYIDPHETYQAPSPYRKKFSHGYTGALRPDDHVVSLFMERDFESEADLQYVIDLYDAEINYVDAQLSRVLGKLDHLGWGDSTAVVLFSDHGEEFKDHGSMGHKRTLYDEQLRVPLIISYPRRLASGQRIAGQVSLVDIYPTLLDLLGQTPPASFQGISLVPHIRAAGVSGSPTPVPSRDLFAELGPVDRRWEAGVSRRVIRTDEYKLIHSLREKGSVSKELYHLSADPGETRNIYDARKSRPEMRSLEERLIAFVRAGSAYKPGRPDRNRIELDSETLEILRSLGYLD